ncbi:MAG: choice-of-anchor tandem repeat GloVer-containing protein [Candidatus Cybelea sp.]
MRGKLYGTTTAGGAYKGGTVFSITPGGTEKVLHSFGNGDDGADPNAALVDVKGTLYGTTTSGDAHGQGTVFSLKP